MSIGTDGIKPNIKATFPTHKRVNKTDTGNNPDAEDESRQEAEYEERKDADHATLPRQNQSKDSKPEKQNYGADGKIDNKHPLPLHGELDIEG